VRYKSTVDVDIDTVAPLEGGRGKLPPLWVDVQKLCSMCVMNVRKDK